MEYLLHTWAAQTNTDLLGSIKDLSGPIVVVVPQVTIMGPQITTTFTNF